MTKIRVKYVLNHVGEKISKCQCLILLEIFLSNAVTRVITCRHNSSTHQGVFLF